MDKCAELGGLNYVDAVSFHPYRGRELGALRPADQYIADLREEMKGYGKPDMPLWNTELYYLIDQQVKHNAYEEGLALPHHVAWRFLVDPGLVGVAYILDEPSIGLHQRDNDRLLSSLMKLRDLGNSLIVVEHDEERIADSARDFSRTEFPTTMNSCRPKTWLHTMLWRVCSRRRNL